MAELRTPPRGDGSDSANRRVPIVVRKTPSTHSGRIDPNASDPDDVLSPPEEPSDDTPTTITRNPPRPVSPAAGPEFRGHRLAHFELIEQIGVGGMAAVLKARDTQLDRTVALKILPPELAADPENIRRFHQEARAAAKLDHENIARVFFCGEDQGLHFIAFEFVEGENLRQVMERKGGRLGVAESLAYMIQVAAGLAHAADRGVVHRDIKPSNIIITPTGRAKLVDMGLARSLERKDEQSLTHSGVTLGTFDYISPEQALEPREADQRSDIYSLGCTLYHILTGRAPVPDGTAARKLHHHQHIKPLDPREFVPDLPDDVVAVLDRMMAKKVEERFQKATHLVQHLVQVARKLGVKTETPEGILLVDTPPAGSPHSTGIVLAVVALLAVVGLIFFLETPPNPEPNLPTTPRRVEVPPRPSEGPGAEVPAISPTERPGQRDPVPVLVDKRTYDSEEPGAPPLAEWLKANRDADRLDILLGRDLDLPTTDDPARTGLLLVARQEVVLRAKPGTRPTLRLEYRGNPVGQDPPPVWAAITIDSPASTLEGVRILLQDIYSQAALVGLHIRKPGVHTVQRCDFIQAQPELKKGRLDSLVFDAGTANPTLARLNLNECCFLGYFEREKTDRAETLTLKGVQQGGLDAVVLRGEAMLQVRQCLMGPHQNLFTLMQQKQGTATLLVEHCTAALGSDSALVQLREQGTVRLEFRHNLVAALSRDEGDTLLLRQESDRGETQILAVDNRYYGLDQYWRVGERDEIGMTDFAGELKTRRRGCSDDSVVLETSPWRGQPLSKIDPLSLTFKEGGPSAPPADETLIFEAFRIDERSRDLRTRETPQPRLIGAERRGELSALAKLEERPPAGHRIVDPLLNDPTNGIYPTLDKAILDAAPGDVILLRHTGELSLTPQRLEKANIHLTLKAVPEYAPILTLEETRDMAPVLFQLHDGSLRLEGLEIRLHPKKAFRSLALVALFGEGVCTLKDCIITLDPTLQEATQLSLAELPETGGVMMMETPRPNPRVFIPRLVLEDCLVRGGGDLVRARIYRPADIQVRNSIIALTGNVFEFEGKDAGVAVGMGNTVSLQLTQVTTYVTGHFLHLRANRGYKLPVPLQLRTESCLFLPASTGLAFVRLEGTEIADPDRLKESFDWKASRTNAYGPYTTLLEQPSLAEDVPLTRETWSGLSGEMFARFTARLTNPPAREVGSLVKVQVGSFRPMDAAGIGADVAHLQRVLPAGE